VIDRSPYGPKGIENIALLFALAGYCVVRQNEVGSGLSGGTFDFWVNSPADQAVTLKWITSQPWSSGKVFTFGASADGIVQYQSLHEPQPAIAAQSFLFSTAYLYPVMFEGGQTFRQRLASNWLAHRQRANETSLLYSALLHEGESEWWDRAMLRNLSNVRAPTLHTAGWYDIFLQPMLDTHAAFDEHLGGRQRLIVGPRGHCFFVRKNAAGRFPNDILDYVFAVEQTMRLFDGQAREEEALRLGAFDLDKITLYIMGHWAMLRSAGDYWTTLPAWPATTLTSFYRFGDDAHLVPSPGTTPQPRSYLYDPLEPIPTAGGNNLFLECGPADQAPLEANHTSDLLLWTTDPFPEPQALLGRVAVNLTFSTNVTDTDFSVRLTAVSPHGHSMLLSDTAVRTRWRNAPRQRAPPLVPGDRYTIPVLLWTTAFIVDTGVSLRIGVTSSNYPRFSANYNNGLGIATPGTPLIAHTTIHDGSVSIPFVPLSSIPSNVI
jgi:putative CocE/NonD family hydrolase